MSILSPSQVGGKSCGDNMLENINFNKYNLFIFVLTNIINYNGTPMLDDVYHKK